MFCYGKNLNKEKNNQESFVKNRDGHLLFYFFNLSLWVSSYSSSSYLCGRVSETLWSPHSSSQTPTSSTCRIIPKIRLKLYKILEHFFSKSFAKKSLLKQSFCCCNLTVWWHHVFWAIYYITIISSSLYHITNHLTAVTQDLWPVHSWCFLPCTRQ